MMRVKATNKYKELNLQDNELGRIPAEGEEWEVTEERYNVLTKTNKYNAVFVEKVLPTEPERLTTTTTQEELKEQKKKTARKKKA